MNLNDIIFQGRTGKFRKYLPTLSYYIIPLLLLGWITYGIFFNPINLYDSGKYTGQWSMYLLAFIMMVRPLAVLLPKLKIFFAFSSMRKELGILTFYLALLHSIGYFFAFDLTPADIFNPQDIIVYGFISLLIMLPLYLTSNTFSFRKLKYWKQLHRLAYIAVIFALIHVGKATGDIIWYILVAVFIALKIGEFYKLHTNQKTINPKSI
ncbi:ferric reductase-like transmembrane domain-containing protein [Candidatus Woesearchaeota archaeon]|nr:ferric reductase-like transmembrane domain-containing protein [Candidatus Woesearchaeota archaeon]